MMPCLHRLLFLAPLLLLNIIGARAYEVPVFTSSTTTTGYVGVAFSYWITANPAATFSAVDLPYGLSLSEGQISGIPLGPESVTNTVVLTATNAYDSSLTSTTNLTIVILPPTPSPAITSEAEATGYIGDPFTYRIVASNATGYGAEHLPAGWTVDRASGAIAGTPRTLGAQVITLIASNATSIPGTRELTLTILATATTNEIFAEDFESGFKAGWQVGDANTSGTLAYWGTVSSPFAGMSAPEGSRMAYCAGIGFADSSDIPKYQNNMRAYMQRSLDLSGCSAVTLTFRSRIVGLETTFHTEACRVRLSANNGQSWADLWVQSREDAEWTAETLDLSAYAGNSAVLLRFEFESDDSVNDVGWFLDEIAVSTGEGDQFDRAASMSCGTNYPSSVAAPNALDVTKVPLRQGYRYVITATGGSLRDPQLWLFDPARNPRANNDDSGGLNSRITFDCQDTGDYYLQVGGVSGGFGTYTLLVTEQPAKADIVAVSIAMTLPEESDPREQSPETLTFTLQNKGPMNLANGEVYSYRAEVYLSASPVNSAGVLLGSETIDLALPVDPEANSEEIPGTIAAYTIPATLTGGYYYVWLNITPLVGAPTDTKLANNLVCSREPVKIPKPTQVMLSGKASKNKGLASLAGATIRWISADGTLTNSTTTTDVGNYYIQVTNGWSGTITPVVSSNQPGLFWPPQRVYTNVSDHLTIQNFALGAPLAISGRLTTKSTTNKDLTHGVSVAFSANGATIIVTADAAGYYSHVVVSGWSGTVTPFTNGIGGAFKPISKSYSKLTTGKTSQNFTWTPPPVISGRLTTKSTTNKALTNGICLAFTANGVTTSVTANASGYYTNVVVFGWTGTVTPLTNGIGGAFTPVSKTYKKLTADSTKQDFIWTPPPVISGRLTTKSTTNKALTNGVCLAFTANGTTNIVTATAAGYYSNVVAFGWTGTVTPLTNGIGGAFTPISKSYKKLTADSTKQDFIWTPPPVISGRLTTKSTTNKALTNGICLAFTANGVTNIVTANASGYYTNGVAFGWTGTVTPLTNGIGGNFKPVSKKYSKLTTDTKQDFEWEAPVSVANAMLAPAAVRAAVAAQPAAELPTLLHTYGWARWSGAEVEGLRPAGDWLQLLATDGRISMQPMPPLGQPAELSETQECATNRPPPLAASAAPILVIRTVQGVPFAELLRTNLLLQSSSLLLLPGPEAILLWDLRLLPVSP
jgi:CheY-specific phosphatase CheX